MAGKETAEEQEGECLHKDSTKGEKVEKKNRYERSPAEIKSDSQRHYGEMAECAPNLKVREDFKRPVYQVARLIRKQGEHLHETPDE